MAKSAKSESVAAIVASATKKYGDKLNVGFRAPVESSSTGNLAIDWITDVDGFPRGRTIMLRGKSQSGKTTCALQFAAEVQRELRESNSDQVILYLDYECALDQDYVNALGFDISDEETVIMFRPRDFETGASVLKQLIEAGKVRMFIWDSIPAAIPNTVFEEEVGKQLISPLARILGPFMGQLNPLMEASGCTGVFINHITDKIGGGPGFGPPEKISPGGVKAVYYSSIILDFNRVGGEKGKVYDIYGEENEVWVASVIEITCHKNKVGRPMRKVKALIKYGSGFDNFWSAYKILSNRGLISGATWVTFDESLTHPDMAGGKLNGKNKVNEFASTHPEWREQVINVATELLASAPDSGMMVVEKPTGLQVDASELLDN